MNVLTKRMAHRRSQKIALCAVISFFVVTFAIPSLAVARDDRDWHEHERHAQHYRGQHPDYVYAPPVVYAPPPPAYESPGAQPGYPF